MDNLVISPESKLLIESVIEAAKDDTFAQGRLATRDAEAKLHDARTRLARRIARLEERLTIFSEAFKHDRRRQVRV